MICGGEPGEEASVTIETATDFGKMCRELRMNRHLTQRKIAEQCGIAITTVGGIEGSPHRVVGLKRATILADEVFHLRGVERARFLDAWERTPLGEFGERRKEKWRIEHERRSKATNYDRVMAAACEHAMQHIDEYDKEVCKCDFGEPRCGFCTFLHHLGVLDGWQNWETTQEALMKIAKAHQPKPRKKPNGTNGNGRA